MRWLDYFRRTSPGSANVAKDRLAIIVAREGQTQVQETPEAIREALVK